MNKLKPLPPWASLELKTSSRSPIRSRSPVKMKKTEEFTTEWQKEHQSKGIGSLKKNKLGQFGYHAFISQKERDKALKKAVKEYGALSIFRSLNAIYVYNKNTNPEASEIFLADRNMIRDVYMD